MSAPHILPSLWQITVFAFGMIGAITPLWAEAPLKESACQGLPAEMTEVRIKGLADDGALTLTDGRLFLPSGIAMPSRLYPDEGMIRAARAVVESTFSGQALQLAQGSSDRHGRLVGPAELPTGQSLTLALLQAGAGYAQPELPTPPRTRARAEAISRCNQAILSAENEARKDRRGIWAISGSITKATDETGLAARIGLYTLVEGKVTATGESRDRIYVNFGRHWREDFTIMLALRDFKPIFGNSLDPAMLRGTVVRVRGVLREQGGPAIFARVAEDVTWLNRTNEERDGK